MINVIFFMIFYQAINYYINNEKKIIMNSPIILIPILENESFTSQKNILLKNSLENNIIFNKNNYNFTVLNSNEFPDIDFNDTTNYHNIEYNLQQKKAATLILIFINKKEVQINIIHSLSRSKYFCNNDGYQSKMLINLIGNQALNCLKYIYKKDLNNLYRFVPMFYNRGWDETFLSIDRL